MKRPLLLVRQKYSFSCTASVLQTAHHFLCGEVLSHENAIRLTNCRPDGASLVKVARILQKLSGALWTPLQSVCSVRRALDAGNLVIAADSLTYVDDHAVLLVGVTSCGLYVFDPATGRVHWRRDQWARDASGEFIVLKRTRTTRPGRRARI